MSEVPIDEPATATCARWSGPAAVVPQGILVTLRVTIA